MWSLLKNLVNPLFATELAELEDYKTRYYALVTDFDALALKYNDLVENPIEVEVFKEIGDTPRDFTSVDELKDFLATTKVFDQEYIATTHDCEDFAKDLQNDGLRQGYIVNLELDMTGTYYSNGKPHMLCGFLIDNTYVVVEAQNGNIVYITVLD